MGRALRLSRTAAIPISIGGHDVFDPGQMSHGVSAETQTKTRSALRSSGQRETPNPRHRHISLSLSWMPPTSYKLNSPGMTRNDVGERVIKRWRRWRGMSGWDTGATGRDPSKSSARSKHRSPPPRWMTGVANAWMLSSLIPHKPQHASSLHRFDQESRNRTAPRSSPATQPFVARGMGNDTRDALTSYLGPQSGNWLSPGPSRNRL